MENIVRLTSLKIGQVSLIKDVLIHGKLLIRLCELGFVNEAKIRVVAIAPKQSSYLLDLYGTEFAIGKNICEQILVKVI